MKLHFRNTVGESYSHSVTPLLNPGSAPGSTVTPAGHGHSVPPRLQPVLSMSDANSQRTRGSAPLGNPATRNTGPFQARCGQGQAILYVLGIVLVFALPFAVPVAYSHAIRAADRFSTTVRHGFTQVYNNPALSVQEQSPLSLESASFTSGSVQEPLIPQSSVQSEGDGGGGAMKQLSEKDLDPERTSAINSNHPDSLAYGSHRSEAEAESRIGTTDLMVGESGRAPSTTKLTNSGGETEWKASNEPTAYSLSSPDKRSPPLPLIEESEGGHAYSNPSHEGTLEPASRDLINPSRHEAKTDPWIPHVEIQNGKILLARTFERRLNADVAPQLKDKGEELWGREMSSCVGAAISFSIDQSPKLEAELHIATKCGGGKSCIIKPLLKDFRSTEISLGDEADSVHYVQTKSHDSPEQHKWGPLRGALKVILLDSTVLHVHRSCEDPLASSSRFISVRDLRNVFQARHEEPSKLNTGPSMKALVEEALSYHAKPHHHVTTADNTEARQGPLSSQLSV